MQAEQIADVAVEIVGPLDRVEPLPPFVPHEEKRRARIVFPAEDHVRLKCLEVESAGIARDRDVVERRIAVVVGRGSRCRRKLAHVAVGALGHERLHIRLERHVGRERIVEAHGRGRGSLIQVRERVVRTSGVVEVAEPLIVGNVVRPVEREGRAESSEELVVELGAQIQRRVAAGVSPEIVDRH